MDAIKTYKLGSLFDGSGGFPLAGALCGVEPVWAAEVEPYPIAVTRSRFPMMKHLGDISKVNGAEIEPVDIITFGSPCQDLSVAGKRAGLKHEANGDEETTRSGLFMEAVRIIKEMRTATNGEFPRLALWENVPGAFSSNRGEDFRIVLEELIRVTTPDAVMPPVPKAGWNYADSYTFDGASLAYRVLDAQYWGVPQRRRRIYLVADFRGECAREILFEREGLRGYFTEGRTPWQTAPTDAQGSTGADDTEGESTGEERSLGSGGLPERGRTAADGDGRGRQLDDVTQPVPYTLKIRGGVAVDSAGKSAGKGALIQENKSATLGTSQDQYLFQPVDPTFIIDNIGGQAEYGKESPVNGTLRAGAQGAVAYVVENHPADSRVNIDDSGKVQTLTSRMGTGGGNVPMIMEPKEPVVCLQGNGIDRADTAGCNGKGWKEDTCYTLNTIDRPAVVYAVDQGGGKSGANVHENKAPTLCTTHGGEPAVTYGTDVGWLNSCEEQSPTLLARQYKDPHLVTYSERAHYIVRRLTPTECARLQGFADWWSYIEPKDSLTDEEYRFWCEVYLTKALIDGTVVYNEDGDLVYKNRRTPYKHKTVKQMLTWYNKLYTDSAEYKMWGNGIALPTALYVLQGITDVLNNTGMVQWSKQEECPVTPEQFEAIYNDDTEEDESWML